MKIPETLEVHHGMMSRVKRWAFKIAAGVSLLLCLATIILWITCRNRPLFKAVDILGTRGKYALLLNDSRIALCKVNRYPVPQTGTGNHIYAHYTYVGPGPVAFWMLIPIFLIAPTIQLVFIRRPIPPGHCRRCGYDLRATPERCPECGNVPSVSS